MAIKKRSPGNENDIIEKSNERTSGLSLPSMHKTRTKPQDIHQISMRSPSSNATKESLIFLGSQKGDLGTRPGVSGVEPAHDQRILTELKMAATAVNSEAQMEELSQVLKMLEEQITKTHKLCLQRRKETECCVRQCRELFKAWPLKSKFDKKEEDNTESTRQSQATPSRNPAMEDTGVESQAKEAEKQDLAALEGLLAKAQKAREIQAKIDEASSKANNQKKKVSKKPLPITGNKAPVKQTTQYSAKQSLSKTTKPAPRQSTAVRKPAAQKTATKSTYSAAYGRPPSAKSLIRPTGSRGSDKVYLDSVLNKDAKERNSRNVSREQGHISSTKIREEKESKSHSEESHHNLQLALPSEKDCTTSAKPLETFACIKQCSESSGEFQVSKLQVDGINPLTLYTTSTDKTQSVTGKPRESSGLGSLDSGSNVKASNLQDRTQESFDPFAEGAELTIPGKYRKLKATSTRLYSELRSIAEKRDKSSPCQHFVARLESGFDMEDIYTRKELQDKANGLLEEHEKLSSLTSDVVYRSYNLSEDSSWPEVYKCYRHWQVVLSKLNELQRRTQQLLEAEEQLSKLCPCGNCTAFDRDHSRDSSGVRDEAIGREGCVLLSSWLPDEIEDYSGVELCEDLGICGYGTDDFTYSSLKELHELIQLHHEAQLLCFQFHMKELAGKTLLPLLEKLDPSDRTFVPLYRLIHGLLCGGGKVFPSMVLDNL